MREVEILKKKQLKCYIYTRVSTSMQVDGYSLDAQRDKLRKYAAYEDMVIAGEYSDEGFSARTAFPMCWSLSCPDSAEMRRMF